MSSQSKAWVVIQWNYILCGCIHSKYWWNPPEHTNKAWPQWPTFLALSPLISDADPLSRTPAPVCRHGDNRMSLEGRRAFRRDVTRVVPRYKQDGWVTNRLLTMYVCFASSPASWHIHRVLVVRLKGIHIATCFVQPRANSTFLLHGSTN